MDGDVHFDCQAPTHSTFRVARALNSSTIIIDPCVARGAS
jgi:hypothetical protein